MAVIQATSVTIKELAKYVDSIGSIKARITKIERFFRNQEFDYIIIGKIIISLIGSKKKLRLAIDRTNWQFGIKNLNFFVASIVYGKISG